jgi:hypothetical protein
VSGGCLLADYEYEVRRTRIDELIQTIRFYLLNEINPTHLVRRTLKENMDFKLTIFSDYI